MSLQIPNHTLVRRIDEGAMGEVWLAEHVFQQRQAAVKVLKYREHSAEDYTKLFMRECVLLSKFDHPNIVRIYDSGMVDERAYLVMEHLAGGTLLDRMRGSGVSVAEALTLIVQIASALGAVHQQHTPDVGLK